jgi:hypothetical protein
MKRTCGRKRRFFLPYAMGRKKKQLGESKQSDPVYVELLVVVGDQRETDC